MALTALPINCTLKRKGSEKSSTDAMIGVLAEHFAKHDVSVSATLRIADYNVVPGVRSDEGKGDDWPKLRAQILAHDILIFGTPVWMGQLSSIGKRVCERMDAFLDETDDAGRMPSYGKLAVVAVVGNEDGAHAISAQLYQALVDVGWTIPPSGTCYWVGEAMGNVDFKDLEHTPRKVTETAKMLASSTAHLAGLLKANPYPGVA
jgi:multimeric flavodoxin WrbA